MKTNPILQEIRQTRERLIAEAGMDLHRFFAMMRERETAAIARGEVFIPAPKKTLAVREDAATYGGQPAKMDEPAK